MTYIVVVGDGDIEYFSSEDNHHTVNALPYVLTRRFEVERTAPTSVIEDGDSVCIKEENDQFNISFMQRIA
jgi:hypothetical protein